MDAHSTPFHTLELGVAASPAAAAPVVCTCGCCCGTLWCEVHPCHRDGEDAGRKQREPASNEFGSEKQHEEEGGEDEGGGHGGYGANQASIVSK